MKKSAAVAVIRSNFEMDFIADYAANLPFRVKKCPTPTPVEDFLIEIFQDVDVIIAGNRIHFARKFFHQSNRLKGICRLGIGMDTIDLQAATEKGILVVNAPVHHAAVAELTIAFMLALLKKIPQFNRIIQSGEWRSVNLFAGEMNSKIIGLLGFGRIGKEVAKRLKNWDVEIIAHVPGCQEKRQEWTSLGVEPVSRDELFAQADILSLHLPLNNETRRSIGNREFSMMKKTALIINTSRGPVVDEEALVEALKSGQICAAGLDVFEEEPLKGDSSLKKLENVLLTPHVGGWTEDSISKIINVSIKNCLQLLSGEVPEYTVNPGAIHAWVQRYGKT